MLINYKEAIQYLGSDYKLKKAIRNKELYMIEKGIYSDKKNNYTKYELILKKYNKAFLVKDSALHYLGFIKEEPDKIHIGTARNALRIKDQRVRQHFYSNLDIDVLDNEFTFGERHILCSNNIVTHITDNKNEIRMWNLEALLYDLIRDSGRYEKNKMINILIKFRECSVFSNLNMSDYEMNLYNENKSWNRELYSLVKEIYERAFERKISKEWDWDMD